MSRIDTLVALVGLSSMAAIPASLAAWIISAIWEGEIARKLSASVLAVALIAFVCCVVIEAARKSTNSKGR